MKKSPLSEAERIKQCPACMFVHGADKALNRPSITSIQALLKAIDALEYAMYCEPSTAYCPVHRRSPAKLQPEELNSLLIRIKNALRTQELVKRRN